MSSIATLNGVQYIIPAYNDTGWAQGAGNLSLYLAAIAANTLQPTGGSFSLTADVDFGSSFGIKALYLKSKTANIAASGVVRLASADAIAFRNNANSADILLSKNSSDVLQFGGSTLLISGNIVNADISAGAAIAYSKLNLTGAILNADLAGSIAYSKLILTNSIVNGDILAGTILNSAINANAAIALSKLAALGTAKALQSNSGTGFIEASAVTNTELGYLSGVTSAIQTQLNGKVTGTNAPTNILLNGGLPFWQRNTAFTNPASGTYTADRWKVDKSGGTPPTMDVAQDAANVDQGAFSLKLNITAVGATSPACSIRQDVEDWVSYKGLAVTITARVKTSLTGVHIEVYDGLTTTSSGNHTGGGAYETLTVTKTMSASATAFRVYIGFPSGAPSGTGAIYIGSVMAVNGSTSVGFIPPDYAAELMRCQRYYEKSYAPSVVPGSADSNVTVLTGVQVTSSSQARTTMYPFKSTKRVIPTVTLWDQTGASAVWNWANTTGTTTSRATAAVNITVSAFNVRQTVTNDCYTEGHWAADSEI